MDKLETASRCCSKSRREKKEEQQFRPGQLPETNPATKPPLDRDGLDHRKKNVQVFEQWRPLFSHGTELKYIMIAVPGLPALDWVMM